MFEFAGAVVGRTVLCVAVAVGVEYQSLDVVVATLFCVPQAPDAPWHVSTSAVFGYWLLIALYDSALLSRLFAAA